MMSEHLRVLGMNRLIMLLTVWWGNIKHDNQQTKQVTVTPSSITLRWQAVMADRQGEVTRKVQLVHKRE